MFKCGFRAYFGLVESNPLNNGPSFLEGDELRAIEAIVRRHVPPCLAVLGFATKRLSGPGRPARYSVEVTLTRVNTDPEPIGWQQALTTEIRHGWPPDDFFFHVISAESDFDEMDDEGIHDDR